MNDRINILAEQAGFYVSESRLEILAPDSTTDNVTEALREFAELIVRECAEHALTFNNNIQSLNDKEIRSHSSRVSNYIKDRMGVEE